jgi:hypothetical protein
MTSSLIARALVSKGMDPSEVVLAVVLVRVAHVVVALAGVHGLAVTQKWISAGTSEATRGIHDISVTDSPAYPRGFLTLMIQNDGHIIIIKVILTSLRK